MLLPKPTHDDIAELREGQVLWGWPHCVQDEKMTQLAIDRRLTLIAWEAMNHWTSTGAFSVHVFHKNNELAGYCSVLHALQLGGLTGHYGRRLRAVVISFGATARGAVTGLGAMGVSDVTVLTQRAAAAVASPMPSVGWPTSRTTRTTRAGRRSPTAGSMPMAEFLAEFDIIVNCVLQDTDAPLMFVTTRNSPLPAGHLLRRRRVRRGHGLRVGAADHLRRAHVHGRAGFHYYAVDHSPSHLWNSATWEISEALLPYLRRSWAGRTAWDADETVSKAIEIRDGSSRTRRSSPSSAAPRDYPHAPV